MTFTLYQSIDGQWRWKLTAQNGNVIADCGESYKAKADARHGILLVKRGASKAPVKVVVTPPAPKEEAAAVPVVPAPVIAAPEVAAAPAV